MIGIVFLIFRDRKPKDIKARQKQEKKLKKLEKQQKKRLASQARHQKKEAKLYGNKDSSAKKIDLSAVKKINFAKLKRLKAVNIIAKAAIYFLLICIGFVFLQPIFEMISKAIILLKT